MNAPGGWGSPPGGGGGWQGGGAPGGAGWGGAPQGPPPGQGWGGPPQGGPPGGWGGGPPPPPPGYGPGNQNSGASGTAVAALIMAIASWVFCGCFTSLPAVFMARGELAAHARGESNDSTKGLAQAAFWIAAINVGLSVLVILLYVVMIVFGVAAGAIR